MTPENNVIFTKENCSFCTKAKDILRVSNIPFKEKNVVKNPAFADELSHLIKNIYPKGKKITVPQIWLDEKYIGGYDELTLLLGKKSQSNTPLVCPIE